MSTFIRISFSLCSLSIIRNARYQPEHISSGDQSLNLLASQRIQLPFCPIDLPPRLTTIWSSEFSFHRLWLAVSRIIRLRAISMNLFDVARISRARKLQLVVVCLERNTAPNLHTNNPARRKGQSDANLEAKENEYWCVSELELSV